MTATTFEKKSPSFLGSTLRRLGQIDEIGVLGALIVISILLTIFTEHFSEITNLLQVVRQASYVGMIAVGMVFVMSGGDIDLSVGAMYNLTTIAMAYAYAAGLPFELVLVLGLLVGGGCGFLNGAISIVLRIPTIIVTLGTMTIYRGFSLVLSNATTIANFPKENWFFNIFGEKFFGMVPGSVIMMVIVGIVGYTLYSHTSFGRQVCAIGANRQAARYSGIHVNRTRLMTMTLSGIICAIAAWGLLAFLKAADPSIGGGSEMLVISSAIIGGTSLAGGSGSVIGAIIGSLIIAVIRNGLVLLGVSIYWQGVVTGAVIIAAVALDYIIKRRK
jgi:ribose transport system permease protein